MGQAGQEKVTVNERLLVHLREAWVGQPAPTPAATQEGIAQALGIRANHVSRSVATLLRGGLLEEATARVRGEVRRRRVYSLTSSGRELADRLYATLLRPPLLVEEGTRSSRTTVEAALRLPGGPRTVTGVLTASRDGNVLRPGRPSGVLAHVARIELGIPAAETLVGRGAERGALAAWLSSPIPVLAVSGPRGVGKSTLVASFFRSAADSRHAFWKTLSPGDSPATLAPVLATFLEKLGKPGGGSAPVPLAVEMARRIGGEGALFVFDGLSGSTGDARAWVSGVAASAADAGAKTILVADSSLPECQLLRARGLLQELALEGLTLPDARQLLGPEMPDEQLRRLFRLARGNPLALRLAGLSWKESTEAGLSDSEQALLGYLRATH